MKRILMTILVVIMLILVVPNVASRIDRWYWEAYTSKTIAKQASLLVEQMGPMDNEEASRRIVFEADSHYSSRRDRVYFIICCSVMYGIQYEPEEPLIVSPDEQVESDDTKQPAPEDKHSVGV